MKCQKTTYIMQFLWRELTSDFDIIGPYFTCPSTVETRFLHSVVTRTVLAFTQFGFGVRTLLCDGASTNLSLLKLLCGHSNDLDSITPWFTPPFDGKVFLIVCPSHQVCALASVNLAVSWDIMHLSALPSLSLSLPPLPLSIKSLLHTHTHTHTHARTHAHTHT